MQNIDHASEENLITKTTNNEESKGSLESKTDENLTKGYSNPTFSDDIKNENDEISDYELMVGSTSKLDTIDNEEEDYLDMNSPDNNGTSEQFTDPIYSNFHLEANQEDILEIYDIPTKKTKKTQFSVRKKGLGSKSNISHIISDISVFEEIDLNNSNKIQEYKRDFKSFYVNLEKCEGPENSLFEVALNIEATLEESKNSSDDFLFGLSNDIATTSNQYCKFTENGYQNLTLGNCRGLKQGPVDIILKIKAQVKCKENFKEGSKLQISTSANQYDSDEEIFGTFHIGTKKPTYPTILSPKLSRNISILSTKSTLRNINEENPKKAKFIEINKSSDKSSNSSSFLRRIWSSLKKPFTRKSGSRDISD